MVKNRFKHLYYEASFDHLVILLVSIALVIALLSVAEIRPVFIGISVIILFIALFRFLPRNLRKDNLNCFRRQETMNIMAELASEMNVELHPTKSLEIAPGLESARSEPRPFFSGYKLHYGGTVHIGCTLLCRLDNRALKGVLAHELAHLRKRHSIKGLSPFLMFIPILVYGHIATSWPIIPLLLTFTVCILVISLISWRNEYQADAIAAEHVGRMDMVYALEQVARLIYRPGDTPTHPSFKKRISRLSPSKG